MRGRIDHDIHRSSPQSPDFNFEEWNEATGLTNETGENFSSSDIAPYYDQVERDTNVRKYTEWDDGVKLIDEGFQKMAICSTP